VALEAMACGVPSVASNAGGIPEVVEHGVTGFLADPGDTDSMARYAIELLRDEALYQAFSEAGLVRVREKFCGLKIVEQYEQIYRRLLSK
jgi:glycosyltransferase involved in cell wall biosynthesis